MTYQFLVKDTAASSGTINKGAIAGGVVGGVVGAALIGKFFFHFLTM